MANPNARPIVVKKIRKGGGDGHHGGAWKVAYADFVTAMMAFFLLMWLLNATTEKQRKGLADYFDPSIPLARISGGGAEMLNGDTVTTEETRSGSDEPVPPAPPETAAEAEEAAAAEAEALEALERALQDAIDAAGAGTEAHIALRITPEGLAIEIADTAGEPLFASGSVEPTPRLAELLSVVAPLLSEVRNPIAVIGHTDASPYGGPGGNWALSAERATRALGLMRATGIAEDRFARVSGRAATEPLAEDPLAAQNRRISIVLLRRQGR